MTRNEFDRVCRDLPATTHVVQWGNASVWKIGGKIFALCSSWNGNGHDHVAFKCSDLTYQILTELPGVVPAPYLARAKWVQVHTDEAIDDDALRAHIAEAYRIVAGKLTKRMRIELGLST